MVASPQKNIELKYFVLKCFPDESSAILTSPWMPGALDNWLGGTRWNIEVPEPLVFTITRDEQGNLRPLFTGAIPLMTDELIAALKEVGVDNLDCYSAVIQNEETGEKHMNYKAVNIIGVIKGADPNRSDAVKMPLDDSGLMDTFFHNLVLDEEAIGEHYMFRLAESVSTIIVHKKVRDFLIEKGFHQLTFMEPKEEDDEVEYMDDEL